MEVCVHLHTPAVLPPKKVPTTHWIGSWVGPRAGLDAVVRKNQEGREGGRKET